MCIEILSPYVPIEIPYECEEIEFTGPTSFVANYTALIRNAAEADGANPGMNSIKDLYVLYPRMLLETKPNEDTGKVQVDLRVDDNIREGRAIEKFERLGKKARVETIENVKFLSMTIPDPRKSHVDLNNVRGILAPIEKFSLPIEKTSQPRRFSQRTLTLLNQHHGGLGAFVAQLPIPLKTGDAHWISWRIAVANAGRKLGNDCLGDRITHSFACPSRVRETFVDVFLNAIREAMDQSRVPEYEESATKDLDRYENFVGAFGLRKDRQVSTGYYELNIEMGDPSRMALLDWFVEGDLRMRSGSPKTIRELRSNSMRTQYMWKSGKKVHGDDVNSPDFSLHLTFVVQEPA